MSKMTAREAKRKRPRNAMDRDETGSQDGCNQGVGDEKYLAIIRNKNVWRLR